MTSRLSRRIGVLSVVVVTLLVGSTVLAQGPLGATNNPFAQLSAKLDQILAALSPAAPQPGPVTLSTGLLFNAPPNIVRCTIANVGSTTLSFPSGSVKVRDDSGSIVSQNLAPQILNPGQGFTLGYFFVGIVRCEFSFVGFANDVRANGQVLDPVTFRPTAVLEAR